MTHLPDSPHLPGVPDAHAAAARLAQLYEQLTPARLAQLDDYYAPDARFKDPFNDVQVVPAIRASFAHTVESMQQPRRCRNASTAARWYISMPKAV